MFKNTTNSHKSDIYVTLNRAVFAIVSYNDGKIDSVVLTSN